MHLLPRNLEVLDDLQRSSKVSPEFRGRPTSLRKISAMQQQAS